MEHRNENGNPDCVPWIVYEDAVARAQIREKRHWRAHVLMLVSILLIVGAFIWYLYQYDYVSDETITVDGAEGIANYVGRDGAINLGKDYGQTNPIPSTENGWVTRNHAPEESP